MKIKFRVMTEDANIFSVIRLTLMWTAMAENFAV